jgi:hypothetical protein
VIARAEHGRVVLDLRTVPPAQDGLVAAALRRALKPAEGSRGVTPPPRQGPHAPPAGSTAAAGPSHGQGGG